MEKEYSIKQRLTKGELDIIELLNMSFLIFKNQFSIFFIVILLFSIPLNILMFVYPIPQFQLDANILAGFTLNENFFKPFLINIFFSSVLTSLQISSITFIVQKIISNKYINANQAIIYSIKKFPKVFITFILLTSAISIGSVFFIIPGILAGLFFGFSTYISAIKKEYGISAFKYSISLVKKNIVKILFIFMFIVLFQISFSMVLGSYTPETDISRIYAISYNLLSYTIFYLLTGYLNIVVALLFFNFDYNHGQKINKIVE